MNEPMPGAGPEQHADTERTHGGRDAGPDPYDPHDPHAQRGDGAPDGHGPDAGPYAADPYAADADPYDAGPEADTDPAPYGGVPDAPRPLGVGMAPTGHPPVDAQLRRLEDADHLAVSGHLEVYEDVHRGLRDTLTALDRPDPRS